MNIWITGAQGFVGKTLQKHCKEQHLPCIPTGRGDVDIGSLANVNAFFHANPTITHIINCAAYTRVDDAEKQPEDAYRANTVGPENLGKLARKNGLKLIHVSTDYVFNSATPSPLLETSPYQLPTQPTSVYAKTKQEGEERLLDEFPQACIVRTSWVFGPGGKNFVSSIWDMLHNQKSISIVYDQINRLTYAPDLADVLLSLLCHEGIYHFANHGLASRYEVAQKMQQLIQEHGKKVFCEEIVKVPAASFFTAAPRPRYSVLDTQKIEKLTGVLPRNWQDALKEFVHAQLS